MANVYPKKIEGKWRAGFALDEGFSNSVLDALKSVTKIESESYSDFVERACANHIGRNVKIADVTDNLDISRIENPSDEDLERLEKYRKR